MGIIFHLADFLRTSSLGGRLSDSSEGLLQRDKGGTRWKGVLQERPGSRYINRLLLIKESNIYQISEFSTFLYIGRCKSLDSLKSFLWHAPWLSCLVTQLVKNPPTNAEKNKRSGFDFWVGEIHWRRKWQHTPVFLPGKFHGQRTLVGYIQSMGWQRVRQLSCACTLIASVHFLTL